MVCMQDVCLPRFRKQNQLYTEKCCGVDASGKSTFVKCRSNRKKGLRIKIIANLKCFTNTKVEQEESNPVG